MPRILNYIFRRKAKASALTFSRPLVFLGSDDWGRVGVRDREGFEQLRSTGLKLGEHPYDFYTLETANDVGELASMLAKHRDYRGWPARMTMNFCLANLDFPRMRELGFAQIELMYLNRGLPGHWSRPGLFEAYRGGISQEVFCPAMHGLTHFCPVAIENALAENGERARLLRHLWEAETPYIHWRMPWVGYEYWNPEKPHAGFLSFDRQRDLIQESHAQFTAFFGMQPISACAAGGRDNSNTRRAWAEVGIRVIHNGSGSGMRPPHMDELGLLHLYRVIDLEPAQKEVDTEKYLEIAACCVGRGIPIVISTHSINFHSSIRNFRTPALQALDSLLRALELRYPDLLYVNDSELYSLVNEGILPGAGQSIRVSTSSFEREEVAVC